MSSDANGAAPRPSATAVIAASMRLPFLVLPPVCVLLGAASLAHDGHPLPWGPLLLTLLGAIAAHVAVNTLNEYHDQRSGLDARTERTPFSGGSGMLPSYPAGQRLVLGAGITALAVTVGVGLFFILRHGWDLLPLGLAGVLIITTYTPLMTRSVLLCLAVPGLGFGVLIVCGTHFVLSGGWSMTALVASLVPTFLVCNLLLINQFPDLAADAAVGRRHLIIVHGVRAGVRTYGLLLILTYLTVIVGVILDILPIWSLLGLLTIPLAAHIQLGLNRYAEDIPRLIPFLGRNVLLVLLTPALTAVGMFVG